EAAPSAAPGGKERSLSARRSAATGTRPLGRQPSPSDLQRALSGRRVGGRDVAVDIVRCSVGLMLRLLREHRLFEQPVGYSTHPRRIGVAHLLGSGAKNPARPVAL